MVLSQTVDQFGKSQIEIRNWKSKAAIPNSRLIRSTWARIVALFRSFHLSFPNDVHRLVAFPCTARRLEGKETETRPGAAFDEAVVLFDPIIKVFDLAQLTIRR